jgi:hypothetical protein
MQLKWKCTFEAAYNMSPQAVAYLAYTFGDDDDDDDWWWSS